MLIDWFTVIAQIVNFLILVALLKYFLFDRITKAMDERERTISSASEKADESLKEAQAEVERYRVMNEEFEATRRKLIAEAKKGADALRIELLEQARNEVAEARTAWRESLEREQEAFLVDLRKLVGEQVLSIARAALSDLASADLEQEIAHAFLDRLRDFSEDDLSAMKTALKDSNPQLTVQTSFELSEELKEEILRNLSGRLEKNLTVRWATAENPVCGIELKLAGHKLAWSVESYLDGLEQTVASSLKEKAHQVVRKPSAAENERLSPANVPIALSNEHPADAAGRIVKTEQAEK